MDEKIKEIEERADDGHWRQREDIKYLLSYIKKLEEHIKYLTKELGVLKTESEAKIKDLEEGIEEILNFSSNYSAYVRLADMRDKLKKLVEKEKP